MVGELFDCHWAELVKIKKFIYTKKLMFKVGLQYTVPILLQRRSYRLKVKIGETDFNFGLARSISGE